MRFKHLLFSLKNCYFFLDKKTNSWKQKLDNDYDFDGKTYFHTNENGIRHKWDLEENKWVQVENNTKDNNPTKELSSDNESEEDDNTTDEQRKARQYRKRKAAPGWNLQNHVFTDPENPEVKLYKDPNDGMTYEYDNEKKAWFPRYTMLCVFTGFFPRGSSGKGPSINDLTVHFLRFLTPPSPLSPILPNSLTFWQLPLPT